MVKDKKLGLMVLLIMATTTKVLSTAEAFINGQIMEQNIEEIGTEIK